MFQHGESVTLHKYSRGTKRDAHGNYSSTYTDIVLEGVGVEQESSRDAVAGGVKSMSTTSSVSGDITSTTTAYTVVTRQNVEVTSEDQMTVRGVRYPVDGDSSGPQINYLTGTNFGTRIRLRRVSSGKK